MAKLLTDARRRPQETISIGHLLTALIEAAGGRWNAAESAFHEANAAGEGVGILERAWIAALPYFGVDDGLKRSLRDSLVGWHPPEAYLGRPRSRQAGRFPFTGLLFTPQWLVPHARHYVLGLLSAGLDDDPEASRYAALLLEANDPSDSIGLLRDLSLEIQALRAMRHGDTSTALAVLESAGLRVASHYQVFESMFHTRPLTRFLRAEALAAVGRKHEALGWYATKSPWLDPAFVLQAWTCFRQGELYERLGDRSRAVYHYRRFVARWQHADAAHQSLVRDTRRRLDRLEGNDGRLKRAANAKEGNLAGYF